MQIADEHFTHCNRFTDRMVAYQVAFLLQSQSRSRWIGHLGFVKEIAEAQGLDKLFKASAKKEKYEKTLIENTPVFCKYARSLQHRAVSWYHHYLQHPGNTCLEETIRAAMHWKHMRSTVRSYVKNCNSCQVNKRRSQKYGKLPTKIVTITPWEAVCVHAPWQRRIRNWLHVPYYDLSRF